MTSQTVITASTVRSDGEFKRTTRWRNCTNRVSENVEVSVTTGNTRNGLTPEVVTITVTSLERVLTIHEETFSLSNSVCLEETATR
jgi:hypothetical protein